MQMGIKCLRFHKFPWRSQVFGTQHHEENQKPPLQTIELIKLDGHVMIYHKPIRVSQLMVEFPKHLVCDSDSFYIGQKIPALSEDDQLQLGHKYFLLPIQFFQSVVSFVTVASFACSQIQENKCQKKSATCMPFEIQKTPSGCLLRFSDEFLSQLTEEGKVKEQLDGDDDSVLQSKLCNTPKLQKEFKQLVRSKRWKPKLDTVKEVREKRKFSSFGIKKRQKSKHKRNSKIQISEHLDVASTADLSRKIKSRSRKL